ncbi:hypothetical protein [Streptosporangium sp. NPDC000396]|uniref:hypothetical protein n=1 Tax=Streptosporangium sp. NPDC000396 TaxID=3366185 RepID=UPI00369FE268
MTDSSGANSTGSYSFPGVNTNLGSMTPDPYTMDPDLEMDHNRVKGLGGGLGSRAPVLGEASSYTKTIDMHTLTFGVIGGGLNVAHREVRDSFAKAMEKAKGVLESYKEALPTLAKNVEEAHKASQAKPPGDEGPPPPGGDPGPFGPGGIKPPGGLGDLPKPPGMGDLPKPPGTGDLPKPPGMDDLPKPPGMDDLPKPPGTGDLPKPPGTGDLPKPPGMDDLPKPPGTGDLPKPPGMDDLPKPPGVGDLPKPGGLDDKDLKTQLAGYDPKQAVQDALANIRQPGTSDLRLPGTDGLTTDQRGLGGGYRTGSGGSFPGGAGGASGMNLGRGPGVPGAGALGAGGMPMMPMTPMGGAGGEGDKDRERSTWISQEEDVWGDDGDVAPPVIGS